MFCFNYTTTETNDNCITLSPVMHMQYDQWCKGVMTTSKIRLEVVVSTISALRKHLTFSAKNALAFGLVQYRRCITGRTDGSMRV